MKPQQDQDRELAPGPALQLSDPAPLQQVPDRDVPVQDPGLADHL